MTGTIVEVIADMKKINSNFMKQVLAASEKSLAAVCASAAEEAGSKLAKC